MVGYRTIRARRPFWVQRAWTFGVTRWAVPFRGPWRAGWGTFFLSGAILVGFALPLAAGLTVAGVPIGPALGAALASALVLEGVLDRIYGRALPPSGGGDPAGDREPRGPVPPVGSSSVAIEEPLARRWEDGGYGA